MKYVSWGLCLFEGKGTGRYIGLYSSVEAFAA